MQHIRRGRGKIPTQLIRAAVEMIERRTLLSAVLGSDGTLTITGTNNADSISIDVTAAEVSPIRTAGGVTVTGNVGFGNFFIPAVKRVVINALGGDDQIAVFIGADPSPEVDELIPITVNGGDGNDNINFQGVEFAPGENNYIDAGNGNDIINVQGGDFVTVHGGAGNDTIRTVATNNTLTATLDGDDGNDTIVSASSGDAEQLIHMNGGNGNDTFYNDDIDDHDSISGGAGIDTFLLADTMSGSTGFYALDGVTHGNNSIGADVENIQGTFNNNVTIVGSSGDNDIAVTDDAGVESLVGGGGNDTLSGSFNGHDSGATTFLDGGSGNDLLIGSNGVNHYSGGPGTDSVDYSKRTANLQIFLDGSHTSGDPNETVFDYTTDTGETGEHDTFDGTVEQVYSGSGNDLIVATSSGGDALFGNAGNDTLVAQGGIDALWGGAGNDTINAEDHSYDYIDAGSGIDTVTADRFDTVLDAEHINYPTATSSLSGTVFNDANNNDKQDGGESGLAGWTVYLDLDNTGTLQNGDPTTTTDSHGNYSFPNLQAGSYIIRVIPPSGWQQTTPANGFGQHVTVDGTNTIGDLKFGERKI
jgi:Ca2+-binding RTX toxin-like protein